MPRENIADNWVKVGLLVSSIAALTYLFPKETREKRLRRNPNDSDDDQDIISDEQLERDDTAQRTGASAKELVPAKSLIGKEVRVFYNLHLLTFSIQVKEGNTWRVKAYADYVKLGNARFKAVEGGRDNVRKSGEKNVHAHVYGRILEVKPYGTSFNGAKYLATKIDPNKQAMYYYDPYCVDEWLELKPPVEMKTTRTSKTYNIISRAGIESLKTVTCRDVGDNWSIAPKYDARSSSSAGSVPYVEMVNADTGALDPRGNKIIRPQIWGSPTSKKQSKQLDLF